MEKTFLMKNGRIFVICKEGRQVFVGTVAIFSDMAAQMLSHEVMKPLNWKATGKIMILDYDSFRCTGVGYQIPRFCSPKRAMKKLKKVLQENPQV